MRVSLTQPTERDDSQTGMTLTFFGMSCGSPFPFRWHLCDQLPSNDILPYKTPKSPSEAFSDKRQRRWTEQKPPMRDRRTSREKRSSRGKETLRRIRKTQTRSTDRHATGPSLPANSHILLFTNHPRKNTERIQGDSPPPRTAPFEGAGEKPPRKRHPQEMRRARRLVLHVLPGSLFV